jgi:Transposase DDE domain
MDVAQAPLTEAEFSAAVELLRQSIPEDELPAFSVNDSPATVYTTLVTLWMLTLQRLGGGASMAAIIKNVLAYNQDMLPDNKRVREETLSENSGAYSRARKRLPLPMVRAFAGCVSDSLISQSSSWFGTQRAFIIDGTTMTLSPTSALRDAYPPATNQHGETVWPVMLLTVAHELQSGCALVPEFGAMYGANNTSEARQATAIGPRIPKGSLILADSNFGIFSVAYAMVSAGHDILFRLTRRRYKAMRRQAERMDKTDLNVRCPLIWTPSVKDRRANPDLPADASVAIELHDVELNNGERLYLGTTLAVPSVAAAEAYCHRYDVEHDIRDFKVTLDIENIRAKSDVMVQKELLCSVVAYNLVLSLRREAAKIKNIEPRRLSFTGVWTTMQSYLLHQPPCSAQEWQKRYARALKSASKAKLPNRPGRSYPRQAHPRRPKSTKSTKFMKFKKAQETNPRGLAPP